MTQKPENFNSDDLSFGEEEIISFPPEWGDVCPACEKGKLDYNGLLELECPICGFRYSPGGGST